MRERGASRSTPSELRCRRRRERRSCQMLLRLQCNSSCSFHRNIYCTARHRHPLESDAYTSTPCASIRASGIMQQGCSASRPPADHMRLRLRFCLVKCRHSLSSHGVLKHIQVLSAVSKSSRWRLKVHIQDHASNTSNRHTARDSVADIGAIGFSLMPCTPTRVAP